MSGQGSTLDKSGHVRARLEHILVHMLLYSISRVWDNSRFSFSLLWDGCEGLNVAKSLALEIHHHFIQSNPQALSFKKPFLLLAEWALIEKG